MLGRIAALLPVAAIAIAVCGPASAQRAIWPVDYDHSIAAISLNPSNTANPTIYPGIAKVAGFAKVDRNDPANSSFELNIYPARQEARILNPDGTFRVDSYAELARYTLMMFQSKSTIVTPDGHLQLTGDLTVTHVERAEIAAWSVGYNGAQWSQPRADVHIQNVTFTVEDALPDLQRELPAGFLRISARAVINREDFPGFWAWLRDSIWPIVVEDQHCDMPPFSSATMRDYKGASCVGNLVENPLRESERGERRSAEPATLNHPRPVGDRISILIQVRIKEPR